MKPLLWVIVMAGLFLPSMVLAQQNSERQPMPTAVRSIVDTAAKAPATDLLKGETKAVEAPHSPTKALYLSILPGAGQIYNHQAWKVPIIYALLGGLSYWSYSSYGDMKKFRDEYLTRVNGGAPQLEGYTKYPDANIYNLYVSNNQNFQLAIVLAVAVYGLNLLDAYVYGHLFDFQIDNDISLSVTPSLMPAYDMTQPFSPSLSLNLRF
ncbi:MAG: hypothetical protein IJU90_07280 [Bacteroidales bacterium]|nr:hypothetical protein [Bacteroidales bacterium]